MNRIREILAGLGRELVRVRWIVLLGLVIFAGRLHESDLRVDGLRYAAISREMLTSGNLLVPHIGGELFLNKPPLLFWLTALAMKVLGVGSFSAKIVSVLFGVGLMVLLFHLARRLFGKDSLGYLAALVFATSFTVHYNTKDCRMESMMAFFLLAALYAFVLYLEQRQRRWLLLWGFSSGLAVLTKGVPGVLPLAVAFLYLALFERRALDRRMLADMGLALLVFAATFGWWYAYVMRATPFGDAFFRGQVFDRLSVGPVAPVGGAAGYAFGETYRVYPVYSFLVALVQEYFYYLPFCVYGLVLLWREYRRDRMVRVLAIYLLIVLVGIHFIATKYARYLYPAFPAFTIATAYGLARLVQVNWERVLIAVAIVVAAFVALYPGSLHGDYYSRLQEVNAMARQADLPIMVSDAFYRDMGRWAAPFYFDRYVRRRPASGPYLLVCNPDEAERSRLLFKTLRVAVYLRERNPD